MKIVSISALICYLVVVQETDSVSSSTGPFKINKLNLIWSKAEHSLGEGKLKELKVDLQNHESDELNIKKLKSNKQDKDGLVEAAVREKLKSIMSKYSLERYYVDIYPPASVESVQKESDHELSSPAPNFRDSRLDKLWKKAEKAGFTQEQLMVLHEEFQHQQEKLDDHFNAMNIIEEELESMTRETNKLENSIESDVPEKKDKKANFKKESPAQKNARLSENMQQDLREKYKDIKKGIEKLHRNVIDVKTSGKEGPFEFDVVNKLWFEAEKSKFSDSELESLKEELAHYETRIKKLNHFQNQLEKNQLTAKNQRDGEDKETRHIKKRVKDLTEKVEKTHRTLNKRITKLKDEL